MEKTNNIHDMLKNGEKIICSLENMSVPSKINVTQEEIEWLSRDCPEVKSIYAFSFDKIKEIQYGSERTSFDTLFYASEKSKNLNYLIEFKKVDLRELKKYCVRDKSSNKYKDSINRKIQDSSYVLSHCVFDDARDGKKMVSSTHIVIVYAEDGKIPVYMRKKDISKERKHKKTPAIINHMPDMAFMLESSISSKEYVKKSIGKSAEDNNFSTKKEKNDLIQNLSVTAKKSNYAQDRQSKEGYVTLLNKNEFIRKIKAKLEEDTYCPWDWGEFNKYFDAFKNIIE